MFREGCNGPMIKQQDIKKRTDPIARRSASSLKEGVNKRVKFLFVTALELIEVRFGKSFEGYDELRAKILRVGNDVLRSIEEMVDSYNVEKVPEQIVVFTQAAEAEEGRQDGEV